MTQLTEQDANYWYCNGYNKSTEEITTAVLHSAAWNGTPAEIKQALIYLGKLIESRQITVIDGPRNK